MKRREQQDFRALWRGGLALCLSLCVALAQTSFAQAQGKMSILRDSEIENLLRDYARPIFKAAGIGGTRGINIVMINERSFNAFVADSHRIFINVGTLLDSTTPNQVIGVLAHESGHIAGGHLARLRQQLERAQNLSIIAMLLGAAAIAAGAATGSRELGGAASGLAMGSLGLGQRSMLAYQRTEEQAADKAAITYLNATRQSGRGMLETFRRVADQSLLSTRNVDPYALSHPLPQDRILSLQGQVEASPYKDVKDSGVLQQRHDFMRAKISGYTERPDQVARRFAAAPAAVALYARAIAQTQNGQVSEGLRGLDALIAQQPDNPYFHEVKGQTLLENGRAREAVSSYRTASHLMPQDALIRLGLGRALVATEDAAMTAEAIPTLERGLIQEPEAGMGYRFLGMAYARRGDEARAALATAQGHFHDGRYEQAKSFAARAKALLLPGSPGALKAEDILKYKPEKT